jgi:hypothetical protein
MSVRRVRISGELFNSFLRDSELWVSSLPDDVNCIGVTREDPYARSFVLLIESSAFPAVLVGELVPFVDAVFTRKEARADAPS